MTSPWPTKMDTHLHCQSHYFLLSRIKLTLELSVVKQFTVLAAEIQSLFILIMLVEFIMSFWVDQSILLHSPVSIISFILLQVSIFSFPPQISY